MRRTTVVLASVVITACQSERTTGPSPDLAAAAVAFNNAWLSAGGYHSCLSRKPVTSSTWIKYCWGLNISGQLGINSTVQEVHTPTAVQSVGGFYVIGDAGQDHTCALVGTNAYCWGKNQYGQLGDGTTTNRISPRLVSGGHSWRMVVTGGFHTCGIDNVGAAFCWGLGDRGQLGNGAIGNKPVPTPVSTAIAFGALTAGGYFTCGWPSTVGGVPVDAYCWGGNESGQLATRNYVNLLKPGAKVASSEPRWSALSAGFSFVCAENNPSVPGAHTWCWGDNSYYQLGKAETTHQSTYNTPQPVALNYFMAPITTGHSFACGIASTTMYCWGRGDLGQLGNGFYVNRPQPYPVLGGYSWAVLAGGWEHMIATRTDGGVMAWGYNTFGQLGDGTTNTRGSPVLILAP
jgi:alpha-tubulin suppressor-like RCC1 family protein